MTKVDRAQVLAYRASRHQFDRTVGAPVDLAVLDLGVQFASPEGGAVSLAARLEPGFDPSGLRAAWTHRGAPHWHRPGELLDLANALWPLSDDDAGNRLAALGSKLRKAAFSATDAMRVTAEAVADALSDVDEDGITKGELSTAVTAELPDLLTPWCGPCGVAHVNEQLLRLATLPGGGCIVPGPPPVRFTRLERWRAVPKKAAGTRSVVCSYLHLHGPAQRSDVARFVGTTARALEPVWPGNLVEVTYDGRNGYLAEADLGDLKAAEAPDGVRLLPPWDPYLQARDRDLLVPDRAQQKEIWKIIGNPGAILVGAEVVGTWRAKKASKKLKVNLAPFAKLTKKVLAVITDEAELMGAIRGCPSTDVVVA